MRQTKYEVLKYISDTNVKLFDMYIVPYEKILNENIHNCLGLANKIFIESNNNKEIFDVYNAGDLLDEINAKYPSDFIINFKLNNPVQNIYKDISLNLSDFLFTDITSTEINHVFKIKDMQYYDIEKEIFELLCLADYIQFLYSLLQRFSDVLSILFVIFRDAFRLNMNLNCVKLACGRHPRIYRIALKNLNNELNTLNQVHIEKSRGFTYEKILDKAYVDYEKENQLAVKHSDRVIIKYNDFVKISQKCYKRYQNFKNFLNNKYNYTCNDK